MAERSQWYWPHRGLLHHMNIPNTCPLWGFPYTIDLKTRVFEFLPYRQAVVTCFACAVHQGVWMRGAHDWEVV